MVRLIPKSDNVFFGKIIDSDGTKYRAIEIQIHTPGKTQIISKFILSKFSPFTTKAL